MRDEEFVKEELEEGCCCGGNDEGCCCSCEDGEDEGCCGGCDDGEEGGCCGGGCGGCGGCHMEPIMEGKNVGKTVRTHYKGTFNDGSVFDSSYDRGTPLEFVCGVGMMIRGFDAAVANMNVGEKLNIHLEPSEAYGEVDPSAIITMEISELPGAEDLKEGQKVYLQDIYGHPVPVTVKEIADNKITFDANHEMAGKELNFEIELVEIVE